MPRATPAERLERLEAESAKLRAQEIRILARRRAARRKRERKKALLVGAMVMDKIKRGEMTWAELKREMDAFLYQDHQRAAFDLPSLPQRLFVLHQAGISERLTAKTLEAEGFAPPPSYKTWNRAAVRRILASHPMHKEVRHGRVE